MANIPSSEPQTIEELKSRYDDLNQKKIRFETRREAAEEQLNELKATALEQYGTDDVKKLQEKLKQLKAENEKQRAAYQESLDKIENRLGEICLLYTSPSPRDRTRSRMPSSA